MEVWKYESFVAIKKIAEWKERRKRKKKKEA